MSYRPSVPGLSDFGVKLGGNFTQMATSPFTNGFAPGIVGGLYVRRFWRVTAVEVELLASSAPYVCRDAAAASAPNASDTVSKSQFRSIYIRVPVMFSLKVSNTLYAETVPEYSYLLSSADKNNAFTNAYKKSDIFHKSEFSWVLGLEMKLPKKFKVGVR